MIAVRAAKILAILLVFIFGAWLFFWNPVDFATQGLDYGIWDWSIITNGWLSMVIGVVIMYIGWKFFRMHL